MNSTEKKKEEIETNLDKRPKKDFLNIFLNRILDFVLHIFLPPWIFIASIWLILAILVSLVRGIEPYNFNNNLDQVFTQQASIFTLWLEISAILFANYTLDYLLHRRKVQVRYFIIVISAVVLFLFAIILLPYLQEQFRQF